MKKSVAGLALTGAGIVVGFVVGLGMGQKTRSTAPSNVKTSYNDGTVTIRADVQNALKSGVTGYFDDLASKFQ